MFHYNQPMFKVGIRHQRKEAILYGKFLNKIFALIMWTYPSRDEIFWIEFVIGMCLILRILVILWIMYSSNTILQRSGLNVTIIIPAYPTVGHRLSQNKRNRTVVSTRIRNLSNPFKQQVVRSELFLMITKKLKVKF